MPNVLSPRDLVFRPDNMDETVPYTFGSPVLKTRYTMYSLGANHPVRLYSLSALLKGAYTRCRFSHVRVSARMMTFPDR